MDAPQTLRCLLLLACSLPVAMEICRMHSIKEVDVCEDRYNVRRHEIVGVLKTKKKADAICRDYPEYEECQSRLVKGCVKHQSYLDTLGYDKNSSVIAFKGFCAERDIYLQGVTCYEQNFQSIVNCFERHSSGRDHARNELNVTGDWDKFYESLCPIQIDGAHCIAAAVSSCTSEVSRVMKNIAFALVHGKCKLPKYTDFTSEYDIKYGNSAPVRTAAGFYVLYVISLSLAWYFLH